MTAAPAPTTLHAAVRKVVDEIQAASYVMANPSHAAFPATPDAMALMQAETINAVMDTLCDALKRHEAAAAQQAWMAWADRVAEQLEHEDTTTTLAGLALNDATLVGVMEHCTEQLVTWEKAAGGVWLEGVRTDTATAAEQLEAARGAMDAVIRTAGTILATCSAELRRQLQERGDA